MNRESLIINSESRLPPARLYFRASSAGAKLNM